MDSLQKKHCRPRYVYYVISMRFCTPSFADARKLASDDVLTDFVPTEGLFLRRLFFLIPIVVK